MLRYKAFSFLTELTNGAISDGKLTIGVPVNKITLKAYNSLKRFDFNTNCEKYFQVINEFI